MRFLLLLAIFFLNFGLTSCRTGGVILRETPMSVSETRRVVVSVIGEPRSVSQNGREIASKFYDRKDKLISKMESAKDRAHTRVTILGDRRPYDIQVEVLIEGRKPDGSFELVGHDDGKAARIAEKLRQALNQSRDNRNVIDDLRPF